MEGVSRSLPLCSASSTYPSTHRTLDQLWRQNQRQYSRCIGKQAHHLLYYITAAISYFGQDLQSYSQGLGQPHHQADSHRAHHRSKSPSASHAQKDMPHSPPQDMSSSHPLISGRDHTFLVTGQHSGSWDLPALFIHKLERGLPSSLHWATLHGLTELLESATPTKHRTFPSLPSCLN